MIFRQCTPDAESPPLRLQPRPRHPAHRSPGLPGRRTQTSRNLAGHHSSLEVSPVKLLGMRPRRNNNRRRSHNSSSHNSRHHNSSNKLGYRIGSRNLGLEFGRANLPAGGLRRAIQDHGVPGTGQMPA